MRTLALIKVNSIRGALLGVILLLALMMFFVIGAKPSHAADLEGDYTINAGFTNVTSLPTDDKLKPTQFKLYKVGSFVSGEPYVELDSPYDKLGVQLPLEVDKDSAEWTTAWLYCANSLKTKIPAGTEPDKSFASSAWVDGKCTFSQTGLDNGLYLLVGDSQKITDYPSIGQNSYWWPQPMLVSILNKDVKISVKPMYGSASHLKVTKVWQGIPAELSGLVQLESINIEIYYQAEKNAEKELRYTETLSNDNNWTFEWDPKEGEGDPSKWTAVEVIADGNTKKEFDKNFSVSYAPFTQVDHQGDDGDYYASTITNKYDRYELEILKTFDAYIDNGEGNSTSLVFELSGYSDDECTEANRVYHKIVGLQVDKSKGDEQKLDVKDIPRGLKHLKVKEVDSGNYTPDEAEKEANLVTSENDPKGVYKVSFKNSLNNTTHESGVINKFKMKNKAYEFVKRLGKDN